MWKSVVIDNEKYFMKYVKEDKSHKVYLTDVAHVWMEQLTALDLSERCKDMNSLIEAEPEDLAKHVYTTVLERDPRSTRITRNVNGEMCTVSIESQLAGIPFFFTFRMVQLDAEKFCQEVTLPIMLLAQQQQCQLSELFDMLKKKDAEIEQFKLEGAVLKKRKLETEPFSEESIKNMNRNVVVGEKTCVDLFAELCPHLFVLPKTIPNAEESFPHEAEVKSSCSETGDAPPLVSVLEPECPTTDEVDIGSVSDTKKEEEKHHVKVKVSHTKKPKLRI